MAKPLHGVNLGGWLILEKWMTPSVFEDIDAQDEYTLTQTNIGRQRITKHRDTFITEEDFKWLAQHNIQIIRLPVGYWIFENSDSYIAQQKYVDWTMSMAEKYDLDVLIDLHGLEGSQNGHDHSGRVGKALWFHNKTYRQRSITVLTRIAERYSTHQKLWGLQITNEPKFGLFHWKLRRYYKQAYTTLKAIVPSSVHIIFSDGFTPFLLNGALGRSSQAVMDVHLYHGTKPLTNLMSLLQYYKSIKRQSKWLKRLSRTQPIIIGEWSGVFRQSVFDAHPQETHLALIKDHIEKQLASFDATKAWFYWSYKTEKPGVWNFRSLVENETIRLD